MQNEQWYNQTNKHVRINSVFAIGIYNLTLDEDLSNIK